MPSRSLAALAALAAPAGLQWLGVVASYLLGSVPFGLLLVRWFKGTDLRAFGSGNIGATNAMRAAGREVGLAVFALDFLKGWLPVAVIATSLGGGAGSTLTLQVACGAAAVLGHCFPPWLWFRGGKGVATACGALVALDPMVFLGGGLVWLAVFLATRYAGLASIAMGLAFPLVAWLRPGGSRPQLVIGSGLLTVLILVRHRGNIARMIAGTEHRSGKPPRGEERAR